MEELLQNIYKIFERLPEKTEFWIGERGLSSIMKLAIIGEKEGKTSCQVFKVTFLKKQ
ncbi:hypothetical protein G6554_20805 [Bacillus sp. MM2020_4]|nr:hypothetical protein [Bacillus sp. MM2020_4]